MDVEFKQSLVILGLDEVMDAEQQDIVVSMSFMMLKVVKGSSENVVVL